MGHLSHQMSIIRCSFAFGDNYIPFQITMENVMRYVITAVIIYVVGMEIYKDLRTRTFDYLLWTIV